MTEKPLSGDPPEPERNPPRFGIHLGIWASGLLVLLLAIIITGYLSRQRHTHPTDFKYVGPRKCAKCHEEQAASWEETRMAMSFDALRPGIYAAEKEMVGLDSEADYTHDEDCLPCHTTGYGKVGGFVSIETTPDMAGVTCEACHGAGGMYVDTVMDPDDPTFDTSQGRDAGLVYPPSARICQGCHNENSPFVDIGYQFDYKKKVAEGTHRHFQLKYDHGR
jgi:hypothetical protein